MTRPASGAGWQQPMLATLSGRPFSDGSWVFERKLDGVRALCAVEDAGVTLWSRNHKRLNASFPELVRAVGEHAHAVLVADGEIVAFEGNQTSFARLAPRIHLTDPHRVAATGIGVYYYLFDLLRLEDVDVTRLPLRARKRLLRSAMDFDDPLRLSNHRNTSGEKYFRHACALGWEGLIAKRAEAGYRSGRSTDWLKLKCTSSQELVVGGFTDPKGSRTGFGALLVGFYEDGRLRYAGKVGTGYDDATLRGLRSRLDELATRTRPFVDDVGESGVHWAHPELVAEIGFTEWTEDGKLRHPRFHGLRDDKSPEDVVRESAR